MTANVQQLDEGTALENVYSNLAQMLISQHILPKRFVRIRHYGILSSTWKRGRLQALQKELKIYTADKPVKTLLRSCPCCKTGTLLTIEVFSQRGPPGKYLRAKQPVPVG